MASLRSLSEAEREALMASKASEEGNASVIHKLAMLDEEHDEEQTEGLPFLRDMFVDGR